MSFIFWDKIFLKYLICWTSLHLSLHITYFSLRIKRTFPDRKPAILYFISLQIADILSVAKENPQCVPYLAALKKKCESCYRIPSGVKSEKGPFATITHNDLWVNNVMIKFGENGTPIHSKIVSRKCHKWILWFCFQIINVRQRKINSCCRKIYRLKTGKIYSSFCLLEK